MNKSLREEIYEFLGSNDAYVLNEEFIDTEHCTNQIIMMIEKRIDAMPELVEFYDPDYAIGFATAIKKVKEILK